MTLDPVVSLALALLLGWVLAEAGLSKWRNRLHLGAIIDAYRLLPGGTGAQLARPLGAIELGLALAMLAPAARTGAAFGAALLLLVYAGAIALNLRRGRRAIDCGCGGSRAQPLSGALVARNVVLVVLALVLATALASPRALGAVDALVALAAAAVAILGYASVNLLIANHQLLARAR